MDFETIFNNLDNIDKKSINAYRSARQFKNIAIYPLVRIDDKVAPVLVACIVNKLLSCELFLKSLIIMSTKEIPEGHHLIKLLEKSNVSSIVINRMSNFEFKKELEKINNAFVDWRYIYESDE
ncbi:MAG: hypothetical protein PHG18_02495 [Bacilli bacterium]|nr:hypothetical protein [Bacilli bacterium]